ncbi:retrotransposon protein, putative, ty1-copia subclass [Tanacetum coccineum]
METNQTTNNNLIRSILEKEKLYGRNFLDWYRNLRIVLRNEQKLHHLEEALPEATPATATTIVRNAYSRRVAKQQEVAYLICGTHICNTIMGLRGIQKLNKGALDLYIGNGNCAAVEAKGSFDLILPSGMGYALKSVAHILNMDPTKKVNKTTYEIWHEKVLNLSYLKVWGCEALVKRDTPNKLESRSFKCIFVGYTKETMGYNFYYPPENKIFVARVDYEETFSLVANIKAIRILIAITAYYDYEIWQMDVKTAFLNGRLSEVIYMVQPRGFMNPKHHRRVCKLQRSINELKQAFRCYNKRSDEVIKKYGFTKNLDEPCVYMRASGSIIVFLILYVDDILLMVNNIPILQDEKSWLGKCFAMKDLGEAAYILGIKIYQDRSSIPMQPNVDLSKTQGPSTPAENLTSRYQLDPGESHWTDVKNILKYL